MFISRRVHGEAECAECFLLLFRLFHAEFAEKQSFERCYYFFYKKKNNTNKHKQTQTNTNKHKQTQTNTNKHSAHSASPRTLRAINETNAKNTPRTLLLPKLCVKLAIKPPPSDLLPNPRTHSYNTNKHTKQALHTAPKYPPSNPSASPFRH